MLKNLHTFIREDGMCTDMICVPSRVAEIKSSDIGPAFAATRHNVLQADRGNSLWRTTSAMDTVRNEFRHAIAIQLTYQ